VVWLAWNLSYRVLCSSIRDGICILAVHFQSDSTAFNAADHGRQNIQGRHSELRADNDLEINIKAEQEIELSCSTSNTKMPFSSPWSKKLGVSFEKPAVRRTLGVRKIGGSWSGAIIDGFTASGDHRQHLCSAAGVEHGSV